MRYLRTNTATRITVGPFLDKTDGITPEVALTVTSEKLTFVVDTAGVPTLILDVAPTASGGSNDMVHITGDDAGFYDLELAAADVNYLGRAMLSLNDVATHCPVFHEFMIIPAVNYDANVLGTDLLDVNVTQLLGTAWLTPGTAGTPDVNVKLWNGLTTVALPATPTNITAGTITTVSGNVDGSVASVTGAVGSVTGAVGSVTGLTNATVADAVLDEDMTAHQTQGSLGQAIGDPVADTNTIYKAVVTDATGATVGADVVAMKVDTSAILIDTAEIGVAGAGLTAIDLPNQTMDITGNLSGSVGSVTGAVGSVSGLTAATVHSDLDDIQSRLPAALTANGNMKSSLMEIISTALTETIGLLAGGFKKFFNIAAPVSTMDQVAAVTLVNTLTTYTGNTPQTGDVFPLASTEIADIKSDTAAILIDTAEIGTAGAGLTNINLPNQTMDIVGNITGNISGSVGSVTGAVGSVTGAVGSVTGAVGSVTAAVTVGTNNDKTGYQLSATGVDDILRTTLTEGYAADGSAPTLEQFLYMIHSELSEFSISGSTITCKKLNGTTTSMTFTLDSSTDPTSRTRAT